MPRCRPLQSIPKTRWESDRENDTEEEEGVHFPILPPDRPASNTRKGKKTSLFIYFPLNCLFFNGGLLQIQRREHGKNVNAQNTHRDIRECSGRVQLYRPCRVFSIGSYINKGAGNRGCFSVQSALPLTFLSLWTLTPFSLFICLGSSMCP